MSVDPLASLAADERALVAEARERALGLLHRNRAPEGMLAATPGERADERGYTAIFGTSREGGEEHLRGSDGFTGSQTGRARTGKRGIWDVVWVGAEENNA